MPFYFSYNFIILTFAVQDKKKELESLCHSGFRLFVNV
jgi:hypothetical protein